MVVSDLHGDWDAYRHYRDRFLQLHARGQADYLILLGDLIHREGPADRDASLAIVLDVRALQRSLPDRVIYLCGNHELPHIYNITLSKGRQEFTARFQATLGEHRDEVISLFKALPFYVRTRAGVALTHAGAPAEVTDPANAHQLFNWSHQALLDEAAALLATQNVAALRHSFSKLSGVSYDRQARHFLAVSGPEDPRYDDLLRGFVASNGNPKFDLLWSALFTRCEHDYGRTDYAIFLDALLAALSEPSRPQRLLVAGHVRIRGGHEVVVERHLRLASAANANPRQAGEYLLFDTARPVDSMKTLLAGLRPGFD